ncbi:MAG: serine hydrolase, partial [Spirochaeta sp.]|nr:serine hydrolase [Spirochaeta sp.]
MKQLLFLLLVGVTTVVWAQDSVVYTAGLPAEFTPPRPAPEHAAAAAVLDYETRTLLYGVNHRQTWAPASLTKLVTIYAALDAHAGREFSLSEPLPVHPEAWASAMMPGSSLMFLGPDQVVSGSDLFRGLLISSGNDAATEIAYRVSGSVGRFARRMNAVSAAAGFPEFYFEEPAGLS